MQNAPATKSDIQKLETDIQKLETDIQKLDGRMESNIHRLEGKIESLDARTHRIVEEVVRTHERMDRLEGDLKQEMRTMKSSVLAALDVSVGRMETLWRESIIIPRVLDEHGATLRDHAARIGRLESPGRP